MACLPPVSDLPPLESLERVSLRQLRNHLGDYISRIQRGEAVLLTLNGEVVAKCQPLTEVEKQRLKSRPPVSHHRTPVSDKKPSSSAAQSVFSVIDAVIVAEEVAEENDLQAEDDVMEREDMPMEVLMEDLENLLTELSPASENKTGS